MPIETTEDLLDHLEMAISIELATVPPYLFATYSIEDLDSQAALLLRSIVVEEMLHAALATNLLLATGGDARLRLDPIHDSVPRQPAASRSPTQHRPRTMFGRLDTAGLHADRTTGSQGYSGPARSIRDAETVLSRPGDRHRNLRGSELRNSRHVTGYEVE
jgi:hypothetical protein